MSSDLEMIVALTNGKKSRHGIAVLYPDNGEIYSEFDIPNFPYNIFQRKDKIYISDSHSLTCYDFLGNKEWEVSECYGRGDLPITHNSKGFYVATPWLRSEVNPETDMDTGNILGETVYYPEPKHSDLWLAHINYDGKLDWFKFIKEKTEPVGLIANEKRVVLSYTSDETGFFIIDLEGKVQKEVEVSGMTGFPKAIINGIFIYQRVEYDNSKKIEAFIEIYNLNTMRNEWSVSSGTELMSGNINGNQVDCSNSGNILFSRNRGLVKRIDLSTRTVRDYKMNNDFAVCMQDKVFIQETIPVPGEKPDIRGGYKQKVLRAFDISMVPIWSKEINKYIGDQYGAANIQDKGLLYSGNADDINIFLDLEGKVIWTKNMYLTDTAKIIPEGI